jgi:hypothetical protein
LMESRRCDQAQDAGAARVGTHEQSSPHGHSS